MTIFANRAKVTTATTGTGAITLGLAVSGYASFQEAGIEDGNEVSYTVEDGTSFEVGHGTYDADTQTLTRTVLLSKIAGEAASAAPLSLSGSAVVFLTALAEDLSEFAILDDAVTFDKLGIGGAAADDTNRLSVNSPAVLFNHAGDDSQVKVNKAATGDTASILFQNDFDARAEIGLVGDDDFVVKVSPDGNSFIEGIRIDKDTGSVSAPNDLNTVNFTQTGYHDLTEISEPAAPAANIARLYPIDQGGVTELAYKNSAGIVNSVSHVALAATGAVRRRQEDKFGELINVADFGAVGDDGVTDDSAAIDLAIEHLKANRGGFLFFDAKRYRVASNPGIRIDASGIHLIGVPGGYVFGGALNKGTEILYDGADGGTIVFMAPSSGTMASASVSGMTLIANSLANIGLYVGTVHDYLIDRVDIECRSNASSIGAYFTDNIAAGSVFNYRGTIRKLTVNAPGSTTGIMLDGPNPGGGGRHPAFLSFHDCHVTNENGDAYFLRACDDCHFFNCAASRVGGGTGRSIHFYSSNTTELRAAAGNVFWGFNSNGDITVDAGTDYQARGNKVFLTAVDHQQVITDTANLLYVEDWGSSDTTQVPYTKLPIINSIGGFKRTTSGFAKTSNTTLADVTGLSVNVAAGKTYKFRAVLHTSLAGAFAGGSKAAMAGTATATAIRYSILCQALAAAGAVSFATSSSALGSGAGNNPGTALQKIEMEGIVTVNAAGTLTAQYAQNNSSTDTSTVLTGSSLEVFEVS